jgi:hypothetical protein
MVYEKGRAGACSRATGVQSFGRFGNLPRKRLLSRESSGESLWFPKSFCRIPIRPMDRFALGFLGARLGASFKLRPGGFRGKESAISSCFRSGRLLTLSGAKGRWAHPVCVLAVRFQDYYWGHGLQ